MSPERRKQLILAALLATLGVVLYQSWPRTAVQAPASSNQRQVAQVRDRGASPEVPDVKLEALQGERPKPGDANRNLFRFKPKALPPSPSSQEAGPPPPPGLPSPAQVPPIPLRFIGTVKDDKGVVAAFADERGEVFNGREGDTIDGRYRIVRIGIESVELVRIDGMVRQVIPLSNR